MKNKDKQEEKQDSLVKSGENLPTESPQEVGGLESVGVPMTQEVAIRERDHAVNMAAEVLSQRAAELRMNRPIDPNSRAAGTEERELVYAENRLMKAALAIKFTTGQALRCDSSPDQIWEFERAKEVYLTAKEKAVNAKAIEGK